MSLYFAACPTIVLLSSFDLQRHQQTQVKKNDTHLCFGFGSIVLDLACFVSLVLMITIPIYRSFVIGFGEPMVQYDAGKLRWFLELSGSLLGKVDFFLPSSASSASTGSSSSSAVVEKGNKRAKERIGTQTVFAWPFPEAATVAKHLNIRGNSYAAMGTVSKIPGENTNRDCMQ